MKNLKRMSVTCEEWLGACATFLIVFYVYFNTLAPTVTGEDSGELILAAWSLGIPHPPGYPLWCLLAHPFTWLPFGDVAWRVNLSSAFFGAAAAGVLTAILFRLTRNPFPSFATGVYFAFTREMWEQSAIAEVYALNVLCIALSLYILLRWQVDGNVRWLWALAVLYGFSLGGHNTALLLGPLYAVFVLWCDKERRRHLKLYAQLALVAGLCAVAIYCYLPLRSLADPVMDWGNPETLSNWWRHVSREQYAFMMEENPRSVERFLSQVATLLAMCVFDMGSAAPLIGAGGLFCFLLAKQDGTYFANDARLAFGILTLTISATVLVAFSYIQNFDFDPEWIWVMTVFVIPAEFCLALWIGYCIAQLRFMPGELAAFLFLLFTSSPPGVSEYLEQKGMLQLMSSYSGDSAAHYTRAILNDAPEDAIVISPADHFNFPAAYLQAVEGVAPDVTVLRRYGYFDLSKLGSLSDSALREFGEFPRKHREKELVEWLLENTDRPILVSPASLAPKGAREVPYGVFTRLLRDGEEFTPSKLRMNNLTFSFRLDSYTEYAINQELQFALAEQAMLAHQRRIEHFIEIHPRDAPRLNNAGALFARNNYMKEAVFYFEQAAKADPENEVIRKNLERALARTGVDGVKR